MRKAILSVLVLAVLAGCASPPPPSRYDYGPPPPPPQYPPSSMRPYAPPPAPRTAETQVRNVKPLGAGQLTAQNVEAYTDTEEGELRAALRGSGVLVSRMADDLVINMKSDPLFAPGSSELSEHAGDVMQSIAMVVRKYDSTRLQVNGYTDTAGSPQENDKISEARAQAVAHALAEDGVDGKRILARGFGEKGLKIPTGANVSEPRNRRIEIRITPIKKA